MTDNVLACNVVVTNPNGMHARPATSFVKIASQFQAAIWVIKDGQRADGKSILAVLTLAAEEGTQLTLEAKGPDARAALDALVELFVNNFDEQGVVEQ